eukprot:TRINITY_DN8025_c0_g1_i1.p1 TRINITY_DN8025_c0_g1~~TRINITY_DN8025_c0_g1_i1.p1  ORF type:complete len:130 (-),score=0.70 TRINITY_DN8025_c0_g1_i1:98-487(-)
MPRAERVGKRAEDDAKLVVAWFGGELCREPRSSVLRAYKQVKKTKKDRVPDDTLLKALTRLGASKSRLRDGDGRETAFCKMCVCLVGRRPKHTDHSEKLIFLTTTLRPKCAKMLQLKPLFPAAPKTAQA